MTSRASVLLLADDHPGHANTLLDQLHALTKLSRHKVHLFNPRWIEASRGLNLPDFDAVIIHWTLAIVDDNYLALSLV